MYGYILVPECGLAYFIELDRIQNVIALSTNFHNSEAPSTNRPEHAFGPTLDKILDPVLLG